MPSSVVSDWTYGDGTPPGSTGSPLASATVAIHTHGCKLNQADSDAIAQEFLAAGYRVVESGAGPDVVVLNTCTVTANADAKARQALRAARRVNKDALIVATGCYAQRSADVLSQMDAVSLVVGNTQKDRLVSMVTEALGKRVQSGSTQTAGVAGETPESSTGAPNPRIRAMVKIQEGCDQVCAYCIVPKVRGRERSVPPHSLVEQINHRVATGSPEVVLTGTQLGTYGFDLPGASLVGLLERILAETSVSRLRVSSIQPQEFSPGLLDLWKDRRLCPHFHVPLQSGSDRVLKSMRRRYDTTQFAETIDRIRRQFPQAGITTDLIVGFPGESEEEFLASKCFAQSMKFSDMHIFPFSPRAGTSADYLPNRVPEPVKRARIAEMLRTAKAGFRAFRESQLGQTRSVLWETLSNTEVGNVWSGLTDNYIRVKCQDPRDLRGRTTPARLTSLAEQWVACHAL